MEFSETIVVYDLKLATDDRSDKKFLLTLKLCPLVNVKNLLLWNPNADDLESWYVALGAPVLPSLFK